MRPLDPPLVAAPAPEPAYCPRCELRHTRRADWMCPRCGSPVETDVPPPRPAPPPAVAVSFPLGARLAGVLLLVTSATVTGALVRNLGPSAAAVRWRGLVAVLGLAALGIALVLKCSRARWVAAALATVAGVILCEGLLRDVFPGVVRDPLPARARQILRDLVPDHRPARLLSFLGLDAGVLLLVAGRPRAWRIVAALLVAAPLVARQVMVALAR